ANGRGRSFRPGPGHHGARSNASSPPALWSGAGRHLWTRASPSAAAVSGDASVALGGMDTERGASPWPRAPRARPAAGPRPPGSTCSGKAKPWNRRDRRLIKVVVDAETDRLLGAAVLANDGEFDLMSAGAPYQAHSIEVSGSRSCVIPNKTSECQP